MTFKGCNCGSVGIFLFSWILTGWKDLTHVKMDLLQLKAMIQKSCWRATVPMLLLIGLEQKLKKKKWDSSFLMDVFAFVCCQSSKFDEILLEWQGYVDSPKWVRFNRVYTLIGGEILELQYRNWWANNKELYKK